MTRRPWHTLSLSLFLLPLALCSLALSGCDSGADPSADGSVPAVSCGAADECPAGQRCSSVGLCIGPGECRADDDCGATERCGEGSRLCLSGEQCRAEGDCPEGQTCDSATELCVIGGGCGANEFGSTRLPPNVMIVLDRSGSMSNIVDGRTRWDTAKDAVRTVTSRFDSEIRFGLATYSACLPGGCSAGSVVVPIAERNASAIQSFLDPLRGEGSPDGSSPRYLCDSGDPETSTGATLHAMVGEGSLQDPARGNAVLLITDGAETEACTDGGRLDGPSGAAALLAQSTSVRTFVVGFSSDVDAVELNAVATAGATERFYPAEDAAALEDAFATIAESVRSCDFRLSETPPNLEELYVYFNNDPTGIPQDPADGWSYDEATNVVRFHGSACMQLLDGAVEDIDIIFGCEGPSPF
jgi:hypothetical protein